MRNGVKLSFSFLSIFFILLNCAIVLRGEKLKDTKVDLTYSAITISQLVAGTSAILWENKLREKAKKAAYEEANKRGQGEYSVKIPVQDPLIFYSGIFLLGSGIIDMTYGTYKALTTKTKEKKIRIGGAPDLQLSILPPRKSFLEDTGSLVFNIEVFNAGNGIAKDVYPQVRALKVPEGVKFKTGEKRDILPKGSVRFSLKFEGDGIETEGRAEFEVLLVERRGFNSDPAKISFPVKPFYKPEFDIKWAVDLGGDTYIKVGKVVSLQFVVENKGKGEAKNLSIKINTPSEVIVTSPDKTDDHEINFRLEELLPGESKKFGFEFAVAKTFTQKEISIQYSLYETRAKIEKKDKFVMAVGSYVPTVKEIHLEEIRRKAKVAEEELKFEILGKSDIDDWIRNATKMGEDKSRYAFIVGIEKYRNLPVVRYAVSDALSVKEFFVKVLRIPEENIILLVNEDATKTAFETILKTRLPALLNEQNSLYFYFAGHGIPGKDGTYFAFYDSDSASPEVSAVMTQKVWDTLSSVKAKSFIFIDACFSGWARGGETLFAEARGLYLKKKPTAGVSDNISIITASKEDQLSNSDDENKHGLFTYHLLKTLKEISGKKTARLDELYDSVRAKVVVVSKERFGIERIQEPDAVNIHNKNLW